MKLDKKYRILLQGALIFVWLTDLSPLTQTDTYYSVYLLCGLAGLACLLANRRQEKQPLAVKIFAGLFSLAVVMGNFELYQPFYALQSKLNLVLDLAGATAWAFRCFPPCFAVCLCAGMPGSGSTRRRYSGACSP